MGLVSGVGRGAMCTDSGRPAPGMYGQISSAVKQSTGAMSRVRASRIRAMAVWALRRSVSAGAVV